ncbi:hypothetical protein ACP70R_042413 [Stipagrostis hirtigluma subsp. patula]
MMKARCDGRRHCRRVTSHVRLCAIKDAGGHAGRVPRWPIKRQIDEDAGCIVATRSHNGSICLCWFMSWNLERSAGASLALSAGRVIVMFSARWLWRIVEPKPNVEVGSEVPCFQIGGRGQVVSICRVLHRTRSAAPLHRILATGGEPPILHEGPCKNIYNVEGRFIEQLELMAQPQQQRRRGHGDGGAGAGDVRTLDLTRAHALFLPLNVSQLVKIAYRAFNDRRPLQDLVADDVRVVASGHS